jgi:hypothetical protein
LRDIAQIKIVTRIEMSKKFERHFKKYRGHKVLKL